MERLVIDSQKTYCFVYIDNYGKKRSAEFNHKNKPYFVDHAYIKKIVGIFEKITTRHKDYNKDENNPKEWQGVPEGYYFCQYDKRLRQTSEKSPRRFEHLQHLRAVLKKVKELVADGIDKKTAIKVASKCGCHR